MIKRISKKDRLLANRTGLLLVAFFVMAFIIIARLFYLQIIEHSSYIAKAIDQHKIDKEILQSRGEVFMHSYHESDLFPVIVNRSLNLVYAVPTEIRNPRQTAEQLTAILFSPEKLLADNQEITPEEIDIKKQALEDDIYSKVKKENDPYEPIAHEIDESVAEQIRRLNLPGIYFEEEIVRYYPEADELAHVSGFLGFGDNRRLGQYGIEGYFEQELAGQKGKILGAKDSQGRLIPVSDKELTAAKDGDNIILTLDKIIQNKAYEIIKNSVDTYKAKAGTIIVMDPSNGQIKALAGYPSFDPNNYSEVESINVYRNLAISEAYEPGSIFKVITMAAGLDSGAVTPDETYEDKGFVQIGVHKIENADNKKYGLLNMSGIMENSANTGSVYIALKTGLANFKKYLDSFGFGQTTGLSLIGESPGDISALTKKGDIYLATASYGQGFTATPLQMAVALSAIVNGGQSVSPSLVDYIKKDNGDIIYPSVPQSHQVVTKETSNLVKAMMVSVIKNGHGAKADVPGYYLGGKTGTAEIASVGGYSADFNNHSFIGFGPFQDSRFVIVIRLAEPKLGRFAANTTALAFAQMASFLLQYYQIPPEY